MNRIKELRKKAHMSQGELAQRLHVHQTAISQWETERTETDIGNLQAMAELFNVSLDYLTGKENAERRVAKNIVNISDALPHRVPLLGSVAAGIPILAEENYDVYVDAPEKADFALTIEGDSMEPLYLNGDIVYIRRVPGVDDGQIAVVLIDDSATLKRVFRQKDGVQLVPENRKYPPMFMGSEHDTIEILGVPVGYTRMFKNGRN